MNGSLVAPQVEVFAGGPGRFAGDSWRCTCSTGSAFCRPHEDSQRYPHSARVCSRIHSPLRAVKPNMPKASVTPGTTRLSPRRGADSRIRGFADSSIQVALCGRGSLHAARWVDARRRTTGAVGRSMLPVFHYPGRYTELVVVRLGASGLREARQSPLPAGVQI